MANTNTTGSFVPTNYIWDIQQLQQVDINSPEFKELLVRLYQNINIIALVLNTKVTGIHSTLEYVNGNQYFPNPANNSSTAQPSVLRATSFKTINFGALPNTGAKSVAHGIAITGSTTFTRIYATASDTTGFTYVDIPYASASAVANNIELSVSATNVTITTGANRSNFNICYVVLEWIQN